MTAVGLVWPTQFTWATRSTVQSTPELEQALRDDAAIAIGVSGGKDSCACAIAVSNYLDEFGHRGPRVLIHADLGRIEWTQSLPVCERLAARLGLELIVVRLRLAIFSRDGISAGKTTCAATPISNA